MRKILLLPIIFFVLIFFSCSKSDDSGKKEKQMRDSVHSSYYTKGLEEFKSKKYRSAKYYFENIPDSSKYNSKAKEFLKTINDTLEVYRQNTLLLINQIEIFKENRPILDDLLYDSLISKGILDEDWIKESYREDFESERYDYNENDY